MKILHTSDWHLGHQLLSKKRYREHGQFLEWLIDLIKEERVDVLLVSGDIFDTTTPSHSSQELYYNFLRNLSQTSCQQTVIIGGNHDSFTFLNASRDLLRMMNIHIITSAIPDIEKEIVHLKLAGKGDEEDIEEIIICAVPYLRERDLRIPEENESHEAKHLKSQQGLFRHFQTLGDLAEKIRAKHNDYIPIIGMAHLFMSGGKTVTGDGVRELYVGLASRVGEDVLPECVDYWALGHLHAPQFVGTTGKICYSGSPIPMGFGEIAQEKKVFLLDVNGKNMKIESRAIPRFQQLKLIKGNWSHINDEVDKLIVQNSEAWVEIEYTGDDLVGDMREQLERKISATKLEILKIKNQKITDLILNKSIDLKPLNEMSVYQVFEKCLINHQVPKDQASVFKEKLDEVLIALSESDIDAV